MPFTCSPFNDQQPESRNYNAYLHLAFEVSTPGRSRYYAYLGALGSHLWPSPGNVTFNKRNCTLTKIKLDR